MNALIASIRLQRQVTDIFELVTSDPPTGAHNSHTKDFKIIFSTHNRFHRIENNSINALAAASVHNLTRYNYTKA